MLKIRKHWRVLDMDEEKYDEEDIAVGGEGSLVGRVYFPDGLAVSELMQRIPNTYLLLLHTFTAKEAESPRHV